MTTVFNKTKNFKGINTRKINNKNVLSLFFLFLFLFLFWNSIKDVKIENKDIPNYDQLAKDPHDIFNKIVENKKTEEIIKSKQFKEMNYEDNLVKNIIKSERANLFEKSF